MKHQPFSYQVLPFSCWVTSVTNGLLHLFGDKNRIPGFVLRMLHTVLTDEGVGGGGRGMRGDWLIALEAVGQRCNLIVDNLPNDDVGIEDIEKELRTALDQKAVAICDIHSGGHAVVLIAYKDGWYYGFDPDWDQVKRGGAISGEYEVLLNPTEDSEASGANVRIHETHLFYNRYLESRPFAMGAESKRNVTIISKE